MLKRLKRTWIEEGAPSKSQSPVPTFSEATRSPTPLPHDLSTRNEEMEDLPASEKCASSPTSSFKRSRDNFEAEATDVADSTRPTKLLKTVDLDPLRNHLPEVLDSRERFESQVRLNISTLKQRIFAQATQENTIADIPATKASMILLVELLAWAIDIEARRPKSIASRRRTAVIIVDDSSSMEKYLKIIENDLPEVAIGKYTDDVHSPEPETWSNFLKKDVILAPSHLLLQSLLRGALAMTHIHFMIITDAQNIRNQDSHSSMPIVQLMNDFYRVTDSLSRPRVFVLLSPSSDRRTFFDSKMLKLEQALDAKVFGVSQDKRDEILALPDRPSEIVILYDISRRSSETRLLKQLHLLDPDEKVFRRYYLASRIAHEDVGSCGSDLVWRRGLKAIEANLVPSYMDVEEDDHDIPPMEVLKVKMFNIIKNWPFTMPNLDASSKGFNVSHKFLRLVQVLTTFKPLGEGFRGIIFVQSGAIAQVLTDLLRTLDDRLGFLRPRTVTRHGTETEPLYYQGVFQRFATGVDNLLIATKSIEDLDIPKASVVIRYDLFESQVSHAYARARTRGRESHLIHMVERGSDMDRRILSRITNLDANMLKWTETLCNHYESSVPPSSLRETINPYHSDSDAEDDEERSEVFITDPTTSGRIYEQDATTVVYRYASIAASTVAHVREHERLFYFKDVQKEFGIPRAHICTIHLPGTLINGISGDELPSRAEARRSACFKACQTLYAAGVLDCRIVPIPDRLRPRYPYERMKITSLPREEVKTQGTRPYVRKQPSFWQNSIRNDLSVLYPMVIYVAKPIDGADAFGPLVLLTKEPLPDLRSFRLFFSSVALNVQFCKAAPMRFDDERIKEIYGFTLRVHRCTMNKAITCELENMAYFVLPLPSDWQPNFDVEVDLSDIVPWNIVSAASQHWAVPIRRSSPEELEADMHDAIIQDRWIEFTRRYKVVTVRRDLTPLSKPSDSPREASFESLFGFCKCKRRGFETLEDFAQPIIEVSKCHPTMNLLNPTSKPPVSNKFPAKYLIPELCAKLTIPASTLWTATLLPSIMRRLDDLLLVKEMNAKLFDYAVREDLLHVAICAPSAGFEYDYERLELLGDAFLKYLASIYVFVTNPSLSEGALHVERQKIISNKALLIHSAHVELPSYIQSKVFAYKTWKPLNCTVHNPPKVTRNSEQVFETVERLPVEDDNDARETSGISQLQEVDDNSEHADNTIPISSNDTAIGSPMHISDSLPMEPHNISTVETGEIEDTLSDPGAEEQDVSISRHASVPARPDNSSAHLDPPTSLPRTPKKKQKPRNKKTKVEDQGTQYLGDKAIADVAEAIIGAAYITGGRETALQVTKAMTIPLSNIDRWSDFGRKVLTPPPNSSAKLKAGSITAIEEIIGHRFNRPHLLGQAMTHSSIQGYEATSYERLEFVGDAILDFLVIRHIFDRDQQLSPGALTMLKGAMVSNSALAAVCVWSGLHNYLLFESPYLENSIRAYANELEAAQQAEYTQAKAEGRPPGQYWLGIEPPKALSDVVESIAGAIYISDNFDPIGAEALFDNVLKPFYDKHITLQTLSHHPTKILFELLQAQGCQNFEVLKERDGNIHRCHVVVHDVILASGEDTTPTLAGRMASSLALDALEGDADFMTRTCDCRTHVQLKKTRMKSEFEKALELALAGDNSEEQGDE